MEPYRKQILWYSTSKKGKAYKLYQTNIDKRKDFGDIVFCNNKYIFFSAYDSNENKSYIYRVTIATNKKELIKSFKGVILHLILKVYGDKLYYVAKPTYKTEEATASSLNCIDLSDSDFQSTRIESCIRNYNTHYLSSKRQSKHFWLVKVYGEHSRTDGHNGTEHEYSTDAIYDAKKGKLVREIPNYSYNVGKSVHMAGKRILINGQENNQSELVFYLCSEAGVERRFLSFSCDELFSVAEVA